MANLETNVENHQNRAAGFEVSRKSSGNFELKIWGRFPPNWIGNLSSGLSGNRINIINGTARKAKASWSAEFEIAPARFATDLKNIDFLALAKGSGHTDSSADISLDDLVIGDPGENDGALYVEIKARDQLGFLGTLLNRFAFYSLFPEEMIIDTVNGKIFDRFWIKGVGGSTPSDTAIRTLKQKLESYLAD